MRISVHIAVALGVTFIAANGSLCAQESDAETVNSIEDNLIGSWTVQQRTIRADNARIEQTGTIHIIEKSPSGEYVVLSTALMRSFAAEGFTVLPHPSCEGKKECTFSGGSEGIGYYSDGIFSIDWSGETWMDDIFAIDGDEMHGEDVNGPIHLVKQNNGKSESSGAEN